METVAKLIIGVS